MKPVYRSFAIGVCCVWLLGLAAPALAQVGGPNPVLSKTMTPQRPRVGEPARITITATNLGNANADNVVITDPLPDNMALAGVAASQGRVDVTNRIITIYVGTLAPGQTVTVTNDVVVTREFANDTPFTNCTGLTYRDGSARLACFPLGPAFDPVSVTTPPSFLPEAGAAGMLVPYGLMLAGAAGLIVSLRLRARR